MNEKLYFDDLISLTLHSTPYRSALLIYSPELSVDKVAVSLEDLKTAAKEIIGVWKSSYDKNATSEAERVALWCKLRRARAVDDADPPSIGAQRLRDELKSRSEELNKALNQLTSEDDDQLTSEGDAAPTPFDLFVGLDELGILLAWGVKTRLVKFGGEEWRAVRATLRKSDLLFDEPSDEFIKEVAKYAATCDDSCVDAYVGDPDYEILRTAKFLSDSLDRLSSYQMQRSFPIEYHAIIGDSVAQPDIRDLIKERVLTHISEQPGKSHSDEQQVANLLQTEPQEPIRSARCAAVDSSYANDDNRISLIISSEPIMCGCADRPESHSVDLPFEGSNLRIIFSDATIMTQCHASFNGNKPLGLIDIIYADANHDDMHVTIDLRNSNEYDFTLAIPYTNYISVRKVEKDER